MGITSHDLRKQQPNRMIDTEKQLSCKRCGQNFECQPGDITHCQCRQLIVSKETLQFLEKTYWGCLCVNCLQEVDQKIRHLQGRVFPKPNELREGIHYYKENGFWVFTQIYHMLRGSCCKSGCRHCPYGFKK